MSLGPRWKWSVWDRPEAGRSERQVNVIAPVAQRHQPDPRKPGERDERCQASCEARRLVGSIEQRYALVDDPPAPCLRARRRTRADRSGSRPPTVAAASSSANCSTDRRSRLTLGPLRRGERARPPPRPRGSGGGGDGDVPLRDARRRQLPRDPGSASTTRSRRPAPRLKDCSDPRARHRGRRRHRRSRRGGDLRSGSPPLRFVGGVVSVGGPRARPRPGSFQRA